MPIGNRTPTKLANAVYASRREQDWSADNEVVIVVKPALLDLHTRNVFRWFLRLVFERVAPIARFPYDQLEGVSRQVVWLTNSLTGSLPPTTHESSYAGSTRLKSRRTSKSRVESPATLSERVSASGVE